MDYKRSDFHRMCCDNCGQRPGETDPFCRIEIDHVVPLSRGGTDDESNWQPLCGRCNRYKSVMTNEEARVAATLPNAYGVDEAWPRGFDWSTQTWRDGSQVDWVYGQLFTYPVRLTHLGVRYADVI